MTDSLNLTGRVSLSTEGVDASLARVGDGAERMGKRIESAAGKAGDATSKIGEGAEAGAQKFTRAESIIVSSIKRSTQELQLLGKTASEKLEFKIQAKGLDSAQFAPYLAELKRVEAAQQAIAASAVSAGGSATKSLNNMGMSAAATANALRGVPAQFTDIVTSLQGGQKPLTVFLQQGGQLKDMFGGAGNAARALGGYVAGLVSPFTILAAAVGGVALAYFQGSKEADAYNKALILSGNAAGTTAAQMNQFAASVSGVVGTQAAAAEALAMFAATGRVAGDNLAYFSEVALRLEKTAGVAVDETVKKFAELGKAPVEASKKLNEETNYLTQAVYEQIKALTDQGRAAEAVSLAQNTYADAMKARSTQIAQNIGVIEKAWNGAKSEAKAAWDAFLGIGRPKPVTALYSQLDFARASGAGDDDPTIMNLQKQIAIIEKRDKLSAESAKQEALRAAAQKAGIDASDALGKANEKALSKQEQMNKALKEYRDNIAAVKAVNPNSVLLDAATISKAEAAIREQFKEKAASRAKAPAIKADTYDTAAVKAYLDVIKDLSKIENDAIGKAEELSKAQNRLREAMASPEFAAFNRRKQEEIILAGAAAIAAEDAAAATKSLADERAKELDSYVKSAKSANDKAQALEDEVAMYGKTKSAIAELAVARLKEEKAKQMSYGDDKAVQALDDEIAALRRVAVARDALDGKEASTKAAEETTKAWKKTADDIERALTDSLMRGFESGKSVVTSLRDYIVNAFKSMVIKIAVQPVVGALTGLLGGGASPVASAASSAGGVLGNIGSAAGLLGSGFKAGISSVFGEAGIAGGFSAGTTAIGAGNLAGGLGTLAGVAAPFLSGALALKGLADAMKYTVDDKGGAFVAQASGAGTSSVALRRDFQQNGGLFGGGTTQNSEWRDADASIRGYFDTSIMATTASVKKYADALGLAPNLVDDFKKQIEVSITGLDAAGQQAAIQKAIGGFVDSMVESAYGGIISGVAKAGETSGQTLERLASSLLTVNAAFKAMGTELAGAGIEGAQAASKIADAFGGLSNFSASMGSFFENFYSPEEKRKNTVGVVGDSLRGAGVNIGDDVIGSFGRDGYRALAESVKNSLGADSPAYVAIINASSAFASIAPSADSAAASIMGLVGGINKSVSDSIFGMQYAVADNQGKYNMLDVRGAGLDTKLRSATDINDIAKIAQEQIELINKSFGLLTQDQQKSSLLGFEKKLNEIDTYVTQKGADSISIAQARDDRTAKTIGDIVGAAVAKALTDAEAARQAKPEPAPRPVEVIVNMTKAPGVEVAVGYNQNFGGYG